MIVFDDVVYDSVEKAYQAAKTLNPIEREAIRTSKNCSIAKNIGQTVHLRDGWGNLRLEMMENFLRQKFSDPDLKHKLVATEDAELIEGNFWNDVFFGICNGVGENHLGKLLMKIREEHKGEIE